MSWLAHLARHNLVSLIENLNYDLPVTPFLPGKRAITISDMLLAPQGVG